MRAKSAAETWRVGERTPSAFPLGTEAKATILWDAMGKIVPGQGSSFPDARAGGEGTPSFLRSYLAIFALVSGYLVAFGLSVKGTELLLQNHFRRALAEAVETQEGSGDTVGLRMGRAIQVLKESPWVKVGGVQVRTMVPIGPPELQSEARSRVHITLPYLSWVAGGIFVVYAVVLGQLFFFYQRRQERRAHQRLRTAVEQREEGLARAERIEAELGQVRQRLQQQIEAELPADEVRSLREERAELQRKFDALAQREVELRTRVSQTQALEEERGALEELLDEALSDISHKDEEIQSLETRLQRAAKSESSPRRKRDEEVIARRFRTLYKTLEIDDRAIRDLVGLRDEGNKLRAEEVLKRLADDSDGTAVRRKVAGLPAHLTVFELGFGGKGRIYYTRGRQRPYRILAIGAKNTQNTDLEYLSRLPKET